MLLLFNAHFLAKKKKKKYYVTPKHNLLIQYNSVTHYSERFCLCEKAEEWIEVNYRKTEVAVPV